MGKRDRFCQQSGGTGDFAICAGRKTSIGRDTKNGLGSGATGKQEGYNGRVRRAAEKGRHRGIPQCQRRGGRKGEGKYRVSELRHKGQ